MKFEFYNISKDIIAVDSENMTYSFKKWFRSKYQQDELDDLYYFHLNGKNKEDFFKEMLDQYGKREHKTYQQVINVL